MKKYIATFTTSEQISPDDWKTIHPCMECDETTTVSELVSFFKKHEKHSSTEIVIREVYNPNN